MNNLLDLENSKNKLAEFLTEHFVGFMHEACLVCLNGKTIGILLRSNKNNDNLYQKEIKINWNTAVSTKILNTHKDENRTTDFGAMFISLSLLDGMLNFNQIESSALGTGVDFWVADDSQKINFSGRIEISGIMKAKSTNNIDTRLKIKVEQIKKSNTSGVPAYISIIEFGNPEALIIKK